MRTRARRGSDGKYSKSARPPSPVNLGGYVGLARGEAWLAGECWRAPVASINQRTLQRDVHVLQADPDAQRRVETLLGEGPVRTRDGALGHVPAGAEVGYCAQSRWMM